MSFIGVQDRGRVFLDYGGTRRERWWRYLSCATILATGTLAKCFVRFAMKGVEIENIEILAAAKRQSERENRGFLTYMNHMSLLDDPFIWGILPWKNFFNPDTIRWSLAADNVCFGNRFYTNFFSLGQVLPTTRFGAGPFQGSIDASIALLSGYDTNQRLDPRSNIPREYYIRHHSPVTKALTFSSSERKEHDGDNHTIEKKELDPYKSFKSNWVHIFPEAFVHQVYPPHRYTLRYFKWGIGRMILESTRPPIIVPIYAYGFDDVIPEDKEEDYSIFKKFGKSTLRVKVGQPLSDEAIGKFRQEWVELVESEQRRKQLEIAELNKSWKQKLYDMVMVVPRFGWFWTIGKQRKQDGSRNVVAMIDGDMDEELREGKKAKELRSRVSFYLRQELEKLRQSMGFEAEKLSFGDPAFWDRETGGCRDVPVMGDVNKLDSHKDLDLLHLLKEELMIKTPSMPSVQSVQSMLNIGEGKR